MIIRIEVCHKHDLVRIIGESQWKLMRPNSFQKMKEGKGVFNGLIIKRIPCDICEEEDAEKINSPIQ